MNKEMVKYHGLVAHPVYGSMSFMAVCMNGVISFDPPDMKFDGFQEQREKGFRHHNYGDHTNNVDHHQKETFINSLKLTEENIAHHVQLIQGYRVYFAKIDEVMNFDESELLAINRSLDLLKKDWFNLLSRKSTIVSKKMGLVGKDIEKHTQIIIAQEGVDVAAMYNYQLEGGKFEDHLAHMYFKKLEQCHIGETSDPGW